MNKAFRTIWNDVRQSFVTTSEIQTSHGKRTKSSLSLCIATALFTLSGVASAAYVEPGVIGSTSSWETPEYQKDWGLEAMNASAAYSLGYNGQKTALGMMDSGALLYTHPELDG
jgi:subtilase-type serine protease